jgi:ABC-2 type transport system ATP-binding protein
LSATRATSRRAPIRRLAFHHVELVFGSPVATGVFSSIKGVDHVEATGSTLSMRVSGPIGAVLAAAAPHGLIDVVSREPNLEDVFLAQYGRGDEIAAEPAAIDGR